jgi:hypothetical protein
VLSETVPEAGPCLALAARERLLTFLTSIRVQDGAADCPVQALTHFPHLKFGSDRVFIRVDRVRAVP